MKYVIRTRDGYIVTITGAADEVDTDDDVLSIGYHEFSAEMKVVEYRVADDTEEEYDCVGYVLPLDLVGRVLQQGETEEEKDECE